ncbi:hypothetical protein X907_2033 [Glycocaulis alkaliphilus]|uniref:Uncharacterized protein n=1 Tax=Glycocaulis alkaliphilus TaxID=1434191 RepID=A0A3T0EBK8_9PROT|nr:hypothetical protein [Glycocaulis alkaliphilus]AZU04556.1 hypothetical protein X907_2033 [Glycocaulis alkaliphilus]GGB69528.1 hypothetical protein GCM10007417_06700 [Glycocaulis alkaliphilus]
MRGKDLVGLFNMVVVAGVLGAISYAALVLQPEEYDPETLCLVGETPPHTVIMIDRTEVRYTPSQARRINDVILAARSQLEIGERLSLFELNHRGEIRNTNRFSVCNPGRGDQINPLYRNPNRVQARYDALFDRPLDRALDGLMDLIDSPVTPLLESLAELGNSEDFNTAVPRRRIILISDMLQNTQLYSVYGPARADLANRLPDPGTIARQIEARYGRTLAGVEIEILFVAQDHDGWTPEQRAAIRAHWQAIFAQLGVRQSWQEFAQ